MKTCLACKTTKALTEFYKTEVQNRIRIKLVGAKQRVNIRSSDIAKPSHCPVLGIKLNMALKTMLLR